MEAISELHTILNHYFPWNKSRIDCLVKFIFAMFTVQTVNLASIANVFHGEALDESHYKRIQRFFRWLGSLEKKAQASLANLTFSMLGFPENGPLLYLALDRTNWKLGKIHINLLVLGVRYHGVNIPLVWTSLGKAGTSNASERISLMKRLLKCLGKRYFVLTADREFIGEEWFQFLSKHQIPFVIRIKENTHVRRSGCEHSIPSSQLFKKLKNGRKKALEGLYEVFGITVFIAAGRNKDGELLIVVSNQFRSRALKEYLKRWGIECLFSCLKKRGFCFEETHMTNEGRISALFFVLVIVTAWSMRVGVNTRKEAPIQQATHGRKRKSIFRRGLGALKRSILHLEIHFERLMKFINLIFPENCSRGCYENGF